jgi:hypothetical protein
MTSVEAIEKAIKEANRAEEYAGGDAAKMLARATLSQAWASIAIFLNEQEIVKYEKVEEKVSVPIGMPESPRDYVQELKDFLRTQPDCKLEFYRYTFYFSGTESVAFDTRDLGAQYEARKWLEVLIALGAQND